MTDTTSYFDITKSPLIICHGSGVIVKEPKILTDGHHKDFGYSFYCTSIESQAKKWCLGKKPQHIVNRYEYTPDSSLSIYAFDDISDEWLDFIAACRNGVRHRYDIVEGPMADDTIWTYVVDYLEGGISRAAFKELARFKHPTHQIAFCTDKALKTIQFIGSDSYD